LISSDHIRRSPSLAEIYFQFNELHRFVFVERSKTNGLYTVNIIVRFHSVKQCVKYICFAGYLVLKCYVDGPGNGHKRPKHVAVFN